MRIVRSLTPIALVAGVAGCGGSGAGQAASTVTFTTPQFTIPAGDSFTCFYTDKFSDQEYSVNNADGVQGPGGHHILVYYTDNPRPVQNHPCVDAEMVNWHQIAGSAGKANEPGATVLGLPPGFAIRVPQGKQFVIQAHYINTTGAPMTTQDTVTLNIVDPTKVKNYVSYFATNDDGFTVPPASEYTHTTYCSVPQDLQMILSLGHMHEYGTQFQLDVVDGNNQSLQSLRNDAWSPAYTSHPPITYYPDTSPLTLKQGARLRQSCTWTNPSPNPLAFPNEMCVAFFYYFPEDQDIVCNMSAQ
jgi:hypothetical protein